MNRTTRIALTGGLALAATLTVGGVALADQDVAPAGRFVAVQDPAPDSPDQRDCPRDGAGRGPSSDTATPSASAL